MNGGGWVSAFPMSRFEFTDVTVWVWNKVRLPATGQSAHIIGWSLVHATCVKLASNLTELRLAATAQIFVPTSNLQPFIKVPISIICEQKANVKLVVRKRNVWKGVLLKQRRLKHNLRQMSSAYAANLAFTWVWHAIRHAMWHANTCACTHASFNAHPCTIGVTSVRLNMTADLLCVENTRWNGLVCSLWGSP